VFVVNSLLFEGESGKEWIMMSAANEKLRIGAMAGPADEEMRTAEERRVSAANVLTMAAQHKELGAERLMRAEAERIGRIKDEFLANLSHEIRSPLNAILGWADLLKAGESSDEDMAQGLEVIRRNARAQARLIDDLLDMSRIVSGTLRLDVQRVELATAIASAVEVVHLAAESKGVRLEIVVDPLAGPVAGDPSRVQQIIWNLLSNAIKFTPKGGKIQITVERVNSHIELSISDTGQGIDPAFLPHVFDRFSQGENLTSMYRKGLGLGLAIVKNLAELHGGSVRAKSGGVGKGSTFIVCLPISVVRTLTEGEPRFHPTASIDGEAIPCPDLSGVRVMVVDDDADALELVRRLLERCQATVMVCESGEACMKDIAAFAPSVLITDIGMPGMDGYSLIKSLRALPAEKGGNTPAIALTAHARSSDRRRAMLSGFDLHVARPVEPSELEAVVARLARRA
jgi:signal transduction histidine kinase